VSLPPLALYVHLPWCERKCPYCDFNSHEAQSFPEDAYVDALLDDLDSEIRSLDALDTRSLSSVFVGGGTPSLFQPESIARLLEGVAERLPLAADVEITMEANPGSAERRRLKGYVDAGVNRFSLGVQSLDDKSLRSLGRIHDSNDALRAIEAVHRSGAASFNLDLMHGLPGQSLASGLADVEGIIAARPTHVSWYQLTIEANTRFYRQPPRLPDEDLLGALETGGAARLQAAGFRRYEVSAWARPGAECRHNLNYWRFGDYLGIGAGAHGKITQAAGPILRYRKTRRPEDYLAPGGEQRRNPRELTDEDRCGEFMLGALRLSEGFTPALFESRTGLPLARVDSVIDGLLTEGLLEGADGSIRASALGWRFLDDVVGRFFDADPMIARSS